MPMSGMGGASACVNHMQNRCFMPHFGAGAFLHFLGICKVEGLICLQIQAGKPRLLLAWNDGKLKI